MIITSPQPGTSLPPTADLIAPVRISCPKCGSALGPQIRVTLEAARRAAKRPAPTEAVLSCPDCEEAWIAALWLSIAARAGSAVAA